MAPIARRFAATGLGQIQTLKHVPATSLGASSRSALRPHSSARRGCLPKTFSTRSISAWSSSCFGTANPPSGPRPSKPRYLSSTANRPAAAPQANDAVSSNSDKGFSVVALGEDQYHGLADEYLDNLLTKLEDLQDSRTDVDVEYSVSPATRSFGRQGQFARPIPEGPLLRGGLAVLTPSYARSVCSPA